MKYFFLLLILLLFSCKQHIVYGTYMSKHFGHKITLNEDNSFFYQKLLGSNYQHSNGIIAVIKNKFVIFNSSVNPSIEFKDEQFLNANNSVIYFDFESDSLTNYYAYFDLLLDKSLLKEKNTLKTDSIIVNQAIINRNLSLNFYVDESAPMLAGDTVKINSSVINSNRVKITGRIYKEKFKFIAFVNDTFQIQKGKLNSKKLGKLFISKPARR